MRRGWGTGFAVACLPCLVGACAEPTEYETFASHVVPVLEARCSSSVCHGVPPGAEDSGDVIEWTRFFLHTDALGRVVDVDAAYEATKLRINTVEDPASSTLLRKPLAVTWGGTPHHGRDNFAGPSDSDYRTLYEWIEGETSGGEDPDVPLTALEQLFADTVQPILMARTCGTANCHGVDAAVPYRLDAGLDGRFTVAATRHNYHQSRTMLSLDGDPLQSRLLRKSLPLHAGGIVHKGGNRSFLADPLGPDAAAIRVWACAERIAATGAPCRAETEAPIRGLVFVRGALGPPHHAFDLMAWAPGRDLFYAPVDGPDLAVGDAVNLTAALHDDDADIRDPAVDPTGRLVVFSMRTSAERGHQIVQLDLETGASSVLTEAGKALPGGGFHTDRDPTYGPEGHVWFVSTRHGAIADRGQLLDAEIYELNPASGELTRRTWTPHIERKPVFLTLGEENGGEMAFSALRDLVPDQTRAHPFRFPPGLASEYHQHFGVTPPETLLWDVRELPDGRYVQVLGALDAPWGAAGLGVVDRNLGPELISALPPGLPRYSAPLSRLERAGAIYRDPVGLPDGTIVTSLATSPTTGDGATEPDFAIGFLVLGETPDGSGPTILERRVLIDAPGVADLDPEPVYDRNPGPQHGEQKWDPQATTGTLRHQGLPMIDALLANLEPAGPKVPRTDMRHVRLVESVPLPPDARKPVPPAETPDGRAGATAVSLGAHGVERILAELPLAEDGSFHAELPAGVPFRIQALNADHMAVGVTHNRWFYVAPGQVLNQGVQPPDLSPTYARRCAACHGAADGTPLGAFVQADAITTASLTLSRYEDQNARRPIPAPQVGDTTRLSVDFARDVQPILDRACVGCHGSDAPDAGLDLTGAATKHYSKAYESLLGVPGLVDEGNARASTSYLAEKLIGRELEAPRALNTPGERHGELSADQLLTLTRWIDLGATFIGELP